MSTVPWLRAADCPLLQAEADTAEATGLRLLQRLLELGLGLSGERDLLPALLEEIAAVLRTDQVVVLEGAPNWPVRGRYARRGVRPLGENLPRTLLNEVLDRQAGSWRPPTAGVPAFLAAPVPARTAGSFVLLTVRPRDDFTRAELEYAVAAGHYLSLMLDQLQRWQQQHEEQERLAALISIAEQLVEQRETVPLLEHIAGQAAHLLRCERASIFLWDQNRQELVGRPALGLPNGELRIPDHVGVVGKVVKTGQLLQVDDVRSHPLWHAAVDSSTGFQTRNLLCIPLTDSDGQRVGALEVMNNKRGRFTPRDVELLEALGRQTVAALHSIREREILLRSNAEFEGQARQGCQIIGDSPRIKAIRSELDRLARTDLPLLVLGESGTGKDVVARAVHFSSPRSTQPFIPVNCAAIAESLLESELFGHEKGAFTDAHATRAGKFEAANGGTLFLDEIGDLSAGGQAKLLRVLEEKNVYRVGGIQPIPVDTRIVAATNRDLAEAVRKSKFRQDLYYRLSVVAIPLPPLRERQEDVLLLAEHFLAQFCRNAGRKTLKFSAEAKKRLLHHPWPGNVRELRNLLERVAYLCPGDRIEPADLPFLARANEGTAEDLDDLQLSEATKKFQVRHIQRAIERASGNMSDAAELLGLHRPNLYRKMRLLKMDVE